MEISISSFFSLYFGFLFIVAGALSVGPQRLPCLAAWISVWLHEFLFGCMNFWKWSNFGVFESTLPKTNILVAPTNGGNPNRNLQTSREPLFSGVNSLLVSGRVIPISNCWWFFVIGNQGWRYYHLANLQPRRRLSQGVGVPWASGGDFVGRFLGHKNKKWCAKIHGFFKQGLLNGTHLGLNQTAICCWEFEGFPLVIALFGLVM